MIIIHPDIQALLLLCKPHHVTFISRHTVAYIHSSANHIAHQRVKASHLNFFQLLVGISCLLIVATRPHIQ
jgi:hypothetical protein